MTAIFGAGLLLGDGILPAISVAGAVKDCEPSFSTVWQYVLPIACLILLCLFSMQHKGTISSVPSLVHWYCCGLWLTMPFWGWLRIIDNPVVLKQWILLCDEFLQISGWRGYFLLGGIFLVFTGGGRSMRILVISVNNLFVIVGLQLFSKFVVELFRPRCLFIESCRRHQIHLYDCQVGFNIPLIVIATMANGLLPLQSIILATFLLTKQAVLLGFAQDFRSFKHQRCVQDKSMFHINPLVFRFAPIFLLLTFKNSSNLAHAYGIANQSVYVVDYRDGDLCRHVRVNWSIYKTTMILGPFRHWCCLFRG